MAQSRRELLADRMISTGLSLAILAAIIFLIEVAEWLLTGHWPGWSVEDGLLFVGVEQPLARFDAVQMVVDLLVDVPLAVALYLIGLVSFVLATDLVDPM